MPTVYTFKFEKLVRDKIPQILEAQNIEVNGQIITDTKEYLLHLKHKLVEESKEVCEASSNKENMSELADVMEVIHALINLTNISLEEVEVGRKNKSDKNGQFDKAIYISSIKVDGNNSALARYLRKYERI